MLKRYYTLDESSEFVRSELKIPFSDRDIIDLAKREEISLCFYLDCTLGMFNPEQCEWESGSLGATMYFRGYAKIRSGHAFQTSSVSSDQFPEQIYWLRQQEAFECRFEKAQGSTTVDNFTYMLAESFMVSLYSYFVRVRYEEPITEDQGLSIDDALAIPIKISRNDYVIPASELLTLVDAQKRALSTKPALISRSEEFHSVELTALLQASRKFWQHASRGDKTTQPTNAVVAEWLERQGLSLTLAKQGASIVRPEWAEKGRPTEK